MKKRTTTFTAYLDSGEQAEVTYTSKYIKPGLYENTLVSCIFKGIEIAPVFWFRGADDSPLGIWYAIENNSISLWEKEYV